jgi:hypothetical protein
MNFRRDRQSRRTGETPAHGCAGWSAASHGGRSVAGRQEGEGVITRPAAHCAALPAARKPRAYILVRPCNACVAPLAGVHRSPRFAAVQPGLLSGRSQRCCSPCFAHGSATTPVVPLATVLLALVRAFRRSDEILYLFGKASSVDNLQLFRLRPFVEYGKPRRL